MSVHSKIKRITVPELRARKGGEPIVSLTAYHAHTARYVDPYVDFLLVGDSLGMVMRDFAMAAGCRGEKGLQNNPLGASQRLC